jgi:hypothetical protein
MGVVAVRLTVRDFVLSSNEVNEVNAVNAVNAVKESRPCHSSFERRHDDA